MKNGHLWLEEHWNKNWIRSNCIHILVNTCMSIFLNLWWGFCCTVILSTTNLECTALSMICEYIFCNVNLLTAKLDFYQTWLYVTRRVSNTGTASLRQLLDSPPDFWWVRVAHLFSFLCCVFCFVFLRTVSCAPNVASVSGLSILDCPYP